MAKPARKTKKEKQARKTRKEKPARITKQNKLTNKTYNALGQIGRSFYPRHLHGPFLFTGPTHGPDPWSPDHSPLKVSLPGQLELRVPVRDAQLKNEKPTVPQLRGTRQNHFATFSENLSYI